MAGGTARKLSWISTPADFRGNSEYHPFLSFPSPPQPLPLMESTQYVPFTCENTSDLNMEGVGFGEVETACDGAKGQKGERILVSTLSGH